MTRILDAMIAATFVIGFAVLLYYWHAWVVQNDRKVAAQIERIHCERELGGVLVNHICYVQRRRK